MTTIQIAALQKVVSSGGRTYPIYIGFLPAHEIATVASAPSFTASTTHQDIATNVTSPPIRSWQRPIDSDRVDAISKLFNGSGEFMPNPVLLCENVFVHGAVKITPISVGGVPTDTYRIDIEGPQPNQEKPLWILDGQHRISGLAGSAQKADPVPLVLLLDQGQGFYDGPTLAKIFAQVTTEATRLGELHHEWLTYAFKLRKYSPTSPKASAFSDSMTAVAKLCQRPQFLEPGGVLQANPFMNRVQFNDKTPALNPAPGGFAYTCAELAQSFYKYYFCQPLAAGIARLSPDDFATQFLIAHDALRKSVKNPDKSVFFATDSHAQTIMQDAFIAGVGACLLKGGPSVTWLNLLTQLQFNVADWNFADWTVSLSGQSGTNSKKVAEKVLSLAFSSGVLPASGTGVSNLADHLKGDSSKVMITAFETTPAGRPKKGTALTVDVDRGSTRSMATGTRRLLKLTGVSPNVARVEIVDAKSRPGHPVYYNKDLSAGMPLVSPPLTNPLNITVIFHYYGGVKREGELAVSW